MQKILSLLKKLTLRDLIIIILLSFIVMLAIDLQKTQRAARKTVIVYQAEIIDYKNKLNEEYKSKEIFINDNKSLSLYNKKLEEERNKLKEKVVYLSNMDAEVRVDTVYTVTEQEIVSDSISRYNWNFNNANYLNVNGLSIVNHSSKAFINTINSIQLNTTISANVIEKNKRLHLIIKSDNPYLNITNQDATFYELDKSKTFTEYMKKQNKNINKRKHFGIGIYGGYGLNGYKEDGSYNMKFGPSVGIGIMYNIWQF